jgi:type IV secretion system protein VirB6
MGAGQFIIDLFAKLNDAVILGFVAKNFNALAVFGGPFVVAFAAIYLIVVASSASAQRSESELLIALVKIGIIVPLVIEFPLVAKTLYYPLYGTPGEIQVVILGASSILGVATPEAGIVLLYEKGLDITALLFSQMSLLDLVTAIGWALVAVAYFLVVQFVVAVALLMLLVSKLMLAVILSLGQFALVCLFFRQTAEIFGRWIQQAILFGLIQINVVLCLGLVFFFMQDELFGTPGAQTPTLNGASQSIFLMFLSALCFITAASVGSALASGFSAAVGRAVTVIRQSATYVVRGGAVATRTGARYGAAGAYAAYTGMRGAFR